MRVLLVALSEEGIAPTAEAAPHVERIGARTVGRSIRSGSVGSERAARLARALAVLEQSDLRQARLAGLEEPEAADAADNWWAAGSSSPAGR